MASKKPRVKNKDKLEELEPKVTKAIKLYDLIFISFVCLKKLFSFSGYDMTKTLTLAERVLDEMKTLADNNPGLRKEIVKTLRNCLVSRF